MYLLPFFIFLFFTVIRILHLQVNMNQKPSLSSRDSYRSFRSSAKSSKLQLFSAECVRRGRNHLHRANYRYRRRSRKWLRLLFPHEGLQHRIHGELEREKTPSKSDIILRERKPPVRVLFRLSHKYVLLFNWYFNKFPQVSSSAIVLGEFDLDSKTGEVFVKLPLDREQRSYHFLYINVSSPSVNSARRVVRQNPIIERT